MKMNLASPFPIILDKSKPRQKVFEVLRDNPVELYKFMMSAHNTEKGISLRYHRRRYCLEPEISHALFNKQEVKEYLANTTERERYRDCQVKKDAYLSSILSKVADEIQLFKDRNKILLRERVNCDLSAFDQINNQISFNEKMIDALTKSVGIITLLKA
jgi:hypothetical protein